MRSFQKNIGAVSRMMTLLLLIAGFVWITSGAAHAQSAEILDPNALIQVNFAGDPALTGPYRVDSNGDITMQYIHQVHVGGLTPAQAATAVRKKLATIYRNPQVIVTLLNHGGLSIEVTGAVSLLGSVAVRSDAHLNEVLQRAQLTPDADLTQVQITHGRPNETHTQETVNYLSFVNGQAGAANPALRDGDVIYVPRRMQAQAPATIQVFVRGEVVKGPSGPFPANTTAYDAVQAAGLTPAADKKHIILVRAGTTTQVSFDFEKASHEPMNDLINPVLKDGDVIQVPAADVLQVYNLLGAVNNAGQFNLPPTSWSVADAIGQAKGLRDHAKLKDATITRLSANGKYVTIPIDLTDLSKQSNTLIQAGDSINIPQGRAGFQADPLTVLGIVGTIVGIAGILRR